MAEIDADPGSRRADLERLLVEGEESRAEAMKAFTDSILEMRAQATADEWSTIYERVNEGG